VQFLSQNAQKTSVAGLRPDPLGDVPYKRSSHYRSEYRPNDIQCRPTNSF